MLYDVLVVSKSGGEERFTTTDPSMASSKPSGRV